MTEDETSLTPEQSMAVLKEQQRKVDVALMTPIPRLYTIWGVAWLVGFFLLWSAWDGGNPWFRVPGVVAGVTFAALMVAAIVASAIIGARINRGVRGASDFQGMVYGISWSLSGFAFAAVGMGLVANGASSELLSVYFPSAYALMVGTLYLGGAALWQDKGQLVLGIVLLAAGSGAAFLPQPHNNLLMSIVGGGAFLVGAAVVRWQLRKGR